MASVCCCRQFTYLSISKAKRIKTKQTNKPKKKIQTRIFRLNYDRVISTKKRRDDWVLARRCFFSTFTTEGGGDCVAEYVIDIARDTPLRSSATIDRFSSLKKIFYFFFFFLLIINNNNKTKFSFPFLSFSQINRFIYLEM